MATLEERIIARDATMAVLGLGYVGLPLAVDFAESGFGVIGVDLDARKVATLNAGGSYVPDVPAERVAPLVRRGRLRAGNGRSQREPRAWWYFSPRRAVMRRSSAPRGESLSPVFSRHKIESCG